jgi:pSer/pThr/pTyr-binding forkhead associated (FHA) protein
MSSEQGTRESLHLVVFNSDEILQVLPLPTAGILTIGRGAENTVSTADRAISRRHAQIAISTEAGEVRLTVEDLDSGNGTRVNARAVRPRSPTRFTPGEFVELGSITLLVVRGEPLLSGALASDPHRALVRLTEQTRTRRPLKSLESLAPPKGKPPAPSSSGAPLALPGPGYLFDDLVRRRCGRS